MHIGVSYGKGYGLTSKYIRVRSFEYLKYGASSYSIKYIPQPSIRTDEEKLIKALHFCVLKLFGAKLDVKTVLKILEHQCAKKMSKQK